MMNSPNHLKGVEHMNHIMTIMNHLDKNHRDMNHRDEITTEKDRDMIQEER